MRRSPLVVLNQLRMIINEALYSHSVLHRVLQRLLKYQIKAVQDGSISRVLSEFGEVKIGHLVDFLG